MIGNGHAGFGRAASEKDPQRHLADVVPRPFELRVAPPGAGPIPSPIAALWAATLGGAGPAAGARRAAGYSMRSRAVNACSSRPTLAW